jgi:hypothetical protein
MCLLLACSLMLPKFRCPNLPDRPPRPPACLRKAGYRGDLPAAGTWCWSSSSLPVAATLLSSATTRCAFFPIHPLPLPPWICAVMEAIGFRPRGFRLWLLCPSFFSGSGCGEWCLCVLTTLNSHSPSFIWSPGIVHVDTEEFRLALFLII